LARAGRVKSDRIDAELQRDNTISGQEHAAAARAARPTPEAKAEAWAQLVTDELSNEAQRGMAVVFPNPEQVELLTPYLEKLLTAAESVWDTLGTFRASVVLEYAFPKALASPETLARVDAWLEQSDAPAPAKRYIREARADMARALAAQERDAR
jgi:aminopeptidase N